MRTDFDAIVVGAGPAGCAAAFDLAHFGRRVLLVDRFAFPRVKACAGALTIKAVQALRYPVAPVAKKVCSDLVVGRGTERRVLFRGRHPICVMTVRAELDEYCLAQTLETGVAFTVIRSIDSLSVDQAGVSLETSGGALRCRYLVGADGSKSRVRALSGQEQGFRSGWAIEACVVDPESRRPDMEFDFGVVQQGYGWTFPKGDHVNVGLYTNRSDVPLTRAHLQEYAAAVLGVTSLGRIAGGQIGLGGERFEPAAGRVLLAGDAAGLVDPLLGEGIHNAIKSGQAAAAAIDVALSGGADAGLEYRRRLSPIRDDLRSCARSASSFYSHLKPGYGALTSPLARYSLMRGFAAGWPFGTTKRRFFLLPFATMPDAGRLLAEGGGWNDGG